MAIWYEVHCDWQIEDSDRVGRPTCWEQCNENPADWRLSWARTAAKKAGYKRINGEDVCPACQQRSDLRAALKHSEGA